MTPDRPYLSVVVPVKNGHDVLPRMLDMLSRSELPRETWELIVIDDGSSDDSVAIASAYADLVIRLPGPSHGTGYARNRGVESARWDCVVFLDADVLVLGCRRVHLEGLGIERRERRLLESLG